MPAAPEVSAATRAWPQTRPARVIMRGHAFMQNLRRGHYELGTETHLHHHVAAAFTELSGVI